MSDPVPWPRSGIYFRYLHFTLRGTPDVTGATVDIFNHDVFQVSDPADCDVPNGPHITVAHALSGGGSRYSPIWYRPELLTLYNGPYAIFREQFPDFKHYRKIEFLNAYGQPKGSPVRLDTLWPGPNEGRKGDAIWLSASLPGNNLEQIDITLTIKIPCGPHVQPR